LNLRCFSIKKPRFSSNQWYAPSVISVSRSFPGTSNCKGKLQQGRQFALAFLSGIKQCSSLPFEQQKPGSFNEKALRKTNYATLSFFLSYLAVMP
jgi:hypothetical protein